MRSPQSILSAARTCTYAADARCRRGNELKIKRGKNTTNPVLIIPSRAVCRLRCGGGIQGGYYLYRYYGRRDKAFISSKFTLYLSKVF